MIMTDKEILKAFNQKRKSDLRKAVIRPKFTLHKELIQVVVSLVIVGVSLYFGSALTGVGFTVLCIFLFLFILSQTKNILLLLIFLYQRYAPADIRKACLFTPSCSEYMRLSIMKYGVLNGVRKGVRRIRSCRPPNGGVDEP
ncbi:MAG: membrane protein insertion efficiency factor YidD [Ruminococcus sp.]|nr:membrane protein insertion efficiency factor YidD [Ruminococcus sp.]